MELSCYKLPISTITKSMPFYFWLTKTMIKINVKFKTLLVMVSIKFTKDVVLGESIIQLLVTIVHVMENESVKLIVIVKEMLVIYLRLYKIFQKYAHAGLIFPQLSDEKIIPKLKLKFENKTFGIPVATPK